MAGRREKLRRVGIIPEYRGFTPDGLASGEAIDMTVDELEVLRLCDLEGLNQEAVAKHMGIARATVAAICSRAHRKVANALVNGRALIIEGGNIAYSPITTATAVWPAKEIDTMRVATTYDNGSIFMHFGRSEQFKIYDIQDGKVLNEQVEEITSGTISRHAMNRALQAGVAVAVALAMLRVLTGLSIYWVLIPGYAAALIMSRFVPPVFVGIAFDSGGVASGPMTSTFLLPLAMGACSAVGGNVVTDAFGIVALVALAPLIAIQIMGLLYARRTQAQTAPNILDDTVVELEEY